MHVPPTFIAVVHLVDATHAASEAALAIDSGAGGVFLINHFDTPAVLHAALEATRRRVGDQAWVGVNPLGLDCVNAAAFVLDLEASSGRVDGLWCDNAEIDERPGGEQRRAQAAASQRAGWAGAYFGGVAFKYQRPVHDLEAAAEAAVPWMDVVCTSGPGTGQAAEVATIERLHDALGGRTPLAIASGISAANIDLFRPHAEVFVVATGIGSDYTHLDPRLVSELAGLIADA